MPDNTPTTLTCPSCGAPLEVDGKSSLVRCKFCNNIALVPGLPTAPEAAAPASLEEIRQLADNGKIIEAIRRYRELYDVSLKEAKDAVDALQAGNVIEARRVVTGPLTPEETGRVLEEVQELLRAGNKIGAIRRYREAADVSLTKAKDVVDQVEAALTGRPVPPRPEIPGRPSVTPPARPTNPSWLGITIVLTILVIVGGVLAFALSLPGGPFTPQLFAISPAILLTSEAGAPPDVAALFYNSDKDTRLVGLVDGNTSKLRWQAEPLSGDGYADALAQSADLLYAASGTNLLAYRKNDGSLAWQTQMPDKLNYGEPSLLVTVGRVLTLNLDQSVQAYDAAAGALVWSRRLSGYDRTLRLMGGSLVLLDYTGDDYTYSLVFLDPVTGAEQNIITPACPYSEYSSATLGTDSGLLYDDAQNALYLVFDSSPTCVQRLDLATGQATWQTVAEDSFSFSSYDFSALNTDTTLFFSNESQLLAVDKATGALQTLLTDEDYEFIPLAVTGDRLIVRARRTRGSERFELWGLKAASGERLWRMDLENAKPIDPPDELVGLVDKDESGWTWNLLAGQLVLIQFQAAPNQLVIQTVNPADGTLTSETTVALKAVTGDFYFVPKVIGWQGERVYSVIEGNIYSVDVATGNIEFDY
jgi:outer membrane protein assembly factor BamB/ribosomal protein L7/L12